MLIKIKKNAFLNYIIKLIYKKQYIDKIRNFEKDFSVVPEAGLEPARYFYRGILNPLCLPIPPLGHNVLEISPFYLR